MKNRKINQHLWYIKNKISIAEHQKAKKFLRRLAAFMRWCENYLEKLPNKETK